MAHSKTDNWVRRFIVSDPKRHKKGFTVYKVTSIVFPKASPEAATKVVVWKRYNDFKKLHRELESRHKKLYLQDKFPSFAKSKFFGRFEEEVIEERRQCAINLLEFIGAHTALFTSKVFVKFFESGYSIEEAEEENRGSTEHLPPPITAITEPHEMKTNTDQLDLVLDATNQGQLDVSPVSSKDTRVEGEGPFLKLGGTWQYPQKADSISLSSHSSDDCTTFTDTDSIVSGLSTPLQSGDLQLFDPLQPASPHKQPSPSACSVEGAKGNWSVTLPAALDSGSGRVSVTDGGSSVTTSRPEMVTGHTERPAETFLSLRTKDFTAASADANSHFAVTEGVLGSEAFCVSSPLSTSNCPQNQSVHYIFEAAYHVSQAQQYEANEEYEAAFAFYKAGIACLLAGVQDDPDPNRKQAVKEKTARYLLQAEKIYNEHIASAKKNDCYRKNVGVSAPKMISSSHVHRPLSELKCYKVLGIVDKVMLVLNTIEDCCYIIKVLHKSSCPVSQLKRSIMPQNVPYMVTMYRYFETESAVFLVLQHASGGKLWNHIGSYFQSLPQTPVHGATKGNVYLGRNLIQEETTQKSDSQERESPGQCDDNSVLTDSEDSSQDHSYLELIRNYTSVVKKSVGLSEEQGIHKQIEPGGATVQHSVKYKKNHKGNDHNEARKSKRSSVTKLSVICSENAVQNGAMGVLSSDTLVEGLDNANVSNFVDDSINPFNNNPTSAVTCYLWRNLENLQTNDLVENAQKLLESVSKTLLKSETVVNRLETEQSTECYAGDGLRLGQGNEEGCTDGGRGDADKPSTRARCNSERDGTQECKSSGRHQPLNRKRSTDRRFSSDDIFEGRGRTHSGSLDRSHQWTRLQSMVDQPKPRLPEANVRVWVAELLVAIDTLHRWGIICRDLRPDNVLLGDKGHLVLTYQCQCIGVDPVVSTDAIHKLYTAPEVNGIFQLTPAADWWSFGALVFELITGKSLVSCHPGGIQYHTILNIPDYVSEESRSLLTELLKHNPVERLGSGVNGMQELKSHPFFNGVDWQHVLDSGTV